MFQNSGKQRGERIFLKLAFPENLKVSDRVLDAYKAQKSSPLMADTGGEIQLSAF
jgi:hypothetical protein